MKWKFQEKINKFRKLKPIKYFYYFCIVFNIIVLTLYYHRQPQEDYDILSIFFNIFIFIKII